MPTNVFYNFEYIEHQVSIQTEDRVRRVMTIEPISVGFKIKGGESYYAVFRDAPWFEIAQTPWLMEHVVPKLPQFTNQNMLDAAPGNWLIDMNHPDVKPRGQIAVEVAAFLMEAGKRSKRFAFPFVRLWANYSAFDHVCLTRLWGRRIDVPDHVPPRTYDLLQLAEQVGRPDSTFPQQDPTTRHHAESDARHCEVVFDSLMDGVAP